MALSGSSSVLQNSTLGCQHYFAWSAVQNTALNQSTITIILYAARYSTNGWFTGTKNKNAYFIGGVGSGTINAAGVPQYSTQYEYFEQSRWTLTVDHEGDGTKSLTLVAEIFQTPSPSYTKQTISLGITLDTIPRGMVTVGTSSGNKRGQVYIGTTSGNKQAKEVWIGTPSGNKRAT